MFKTSKLPKSPDDLQLSGDSDLKSAYAENSKSHYKELFNSANAVPIISIFRYYGLHVDDMNRKVVCPFPHHKSGRESTSSFMYYPETNTFWCFGCNTGVSGCDFVANMDGIGKVKAANKILSIFNSDNNDLIEVNRIDFSERLEIMISFSNIIYNFRNKFFDENSFNFIEEICLVYDELNIKYNLSNEALKSTIDQLKQRIIQYEEKCQY